jgi:pyruvate/2-oxoacid:ferredoxin oxidoreductase alpha subunit
MEKQDVKEETQSSEDVKPEPEETVSEITEQKTHEEDVPYDRFQSVTDEKNTYKKLVETLSSQLGQRQNVVQEEELPELDPETEKAVNARLARQQNAHNTQIGLVLDQVDEVKAHNTIPNYDKPAVRDQIEELRREYYNRGQYLNRKDAYGILIGQGILKSPSKITKSEKVVVVNKQKPAAVAETRSTAKGTNAGAKAFKDMSLSEKEKALENKQF